MFACKRGRAEAAKLLMDAGAKLTAADCKVMLLRWLRVPALQPALGWQPLGLHAKHVSCSLSGVRRGPTGR